MLDEVRRFIRREQLLQDGEPVWVAVSGGPDSMVLLHVLRSLGHPVQVAHVDHGLRGAESDADRALVKKYCEGNGIPFRATSVDVGARAAEKAISLQLAAREQRIEWFNALAAEGPALIALAHHRDDAIETLLINLLRGSAGAGRGGMAPRNGNRIRPLLCVDKAAILAYAAEHGIPFREDRSNRDPKYLRSRVRHELLPLLEAIRPGASRALGRSQDLLRELESTGRAHVDHALHGLVPAADGSLHFPFARIEASGTPLLVLNRLLGPMGAHPDVLERIRDAVRDRATGSTFPIGDRTVVVDRNELVIQERRSIEASWTIDRVDALPEGIPLHLGMHTPAEVDLGQGSHVAWLDAGRVGFPLELRPWKAGDRMQPIGLGGSKLISDLLTDAKVPNHRRSAQLVLTSGGEVVWLVGMRLAEGVVATPESRQVLRLEWTGKP